MTINVEKGNQKNELHLFTCILDSVKITCSHTIVY